MRKNIAFFITTFILILITAFCMGSVALGMSKDHARADEAYFTSMERTYVERAREILREAGLDDAGVMLTYVRESDGSRVYTLSVHHMSYERMGSAEREALSKSLEDSCFEAENCTFVQNFF